MVPAHDAPRHHDPHPHLYRLVQRRTRPYCAQVCQGPEISARTTSKCLYFIRQEPEIAHLAGVYLKWLSLGLPAYAFNSVARRYFQSIGNHVIEKACIFC